MSRATRCAPGRAAARVLTAALVLAGLVLAGLALAACGAGPATDPRPLPPRPGTSVVVISFDALRADALGAYGSTRGLTPAMDGFAHRAVVFERAYTAAPVTPTSFAAAFTGRLPQRVFRAWNLAPSPTLAETFQAAGYRTAAFLNNVQLTEERAFDRGFAAYHCFRSVPDRLVLDRAVAWLARQRGAPVFLWIHFLSPHSPYDYRAHAVHLYDPDYRGPYQFTTTARFTPESAADAARVRSLYDGEVLWSDHLFGVAVDALDELGFLDDAVVALTADHGETMGERGAWQHTGLALHEETVRIPFVLRHPDLPRGSRVTAPWSNLDLLPGLAGLAGLEPPAGLDGDDRFTHLPQVDRPVVSVAMTDGEHRGAALIDGDDKLILACRPERTATLHDLASDPGELTDLAGERPERAAELLAALESTFGADPCAAIQAAVSGRAQEEGLDAATVDQLRALGYVE